MEKKPIEHFKTKIERVDNGVAVVTILFKDEEVATLYFEAPKKAWTNKPIFPNVWTCVDSKIHENYIYVEELVTPKELIHLGMRTISEAGSVTFNPTQVPRLG